MDELLLSLLSSSILLLIAPLGRHTTKFESSSSYVSGVVRLCSLPLGEVSSGIGGCLLRLRGTS